MTTKTEVVWTNPKIRAFFRFLMLTAVAVLLWSLLLAIIFGGGFWWGVIFSGIGLVAIYALGEFAGAYDEKIVVINGDIISEATLTEGK